VMDTPQGPLHTVCSMWMTHLSSIMMRFDRLTRSTTSSTPKKGQKCDPEFCLGAELRQYSLPNGVHACWSMLPSKYIQTAVTNVKNFHRLHFPNYQWSMRTSDPFPINYAPDLDTTPELIAGHVTFYQSKVGVLRW
jgi:hypothetical protein